MHGNGQGATLHYTSQNLLYVYIFSYSYLFPQPYILLKLSSNSKLTMNPSFLLKFFFLPHIVFFFGFLGASEPQLTLDYYASTCPTVFDIVRKEMECSVLSNPHNAASILRLHFHDCFIQVKKTYLSFSFRKIMCDFVLVLKCSFIKIILA